MPNPNQLLELEFEHEDRGDYIVIRDVPLFDAHEELEGQVKFDKSRLQKIVNNNNRNIADTGDKVPLVPGHKPDHTPEEDHEILGWATNFKLGTLGSINPRDAILCDFEIPKENVERVKKLPRRSVELLDWKNEDNALIDPIALLGPTAPARQLKLLKSHKNSTGSDTYKYELNKGVENMDMDELTELVRKIIDEKMNCEKDKEDVKEDVKDEPMKNEKEEVKDGMTEKVKEYEALKNERDSERRRYARLEQEHKALHSRIAELEKRENLATRKADLIGVEAEGYVFDMNDELEYVQDMDSKTYSKHLEKIRKNYSKAPIGRQIPVEKLPAHGRNTAATSNLISATDDASEDVARQMTANTEKLIQQAHKLVASGKVKTLQEAIAMARETK